MDLKAYSDFIYQDNMTRYITGGFLLYIATSREHLRYLGSISIECNISSLWYPPQHRTRGTTLIYTIPDLSIFTKLYINISPDSLQYPFKQDMIRARSIQEQFCCLDFRNHFPLKHCAKAPRVLVSLTPSKSALLLSARASCSCTTWCGKAWLR